MIYVSPAIEESRCKLLNFLFDFESVLAKQERIKYTLNRVIFLFNYYIHKFKNLNLNLIKKLNSDHLSNNQGNKPKTFNNLIHKLPDQGQILEEVYMTINTLLDRATNYLKTWLSFQSLWDLTQETFFNRLGENLNIWMQCLNEIK